MSEVTEVKAKNKVIIEHHQLPVLLFRTPSCVVLRGLQFKNHIETHSTDRIFFGKSVENGKTVFKFISYSQGEIIEKTYIHSDDFIQEVIATTNAIRKQHSLAPLSDKEIIRHIDLT